MAGVRNWTWDDNLDAEELGLRLLGLAVRERRLQYRLSQQQLAFRTGVNQSTISRLENARLRTMKICTLARIMVVLELGAGYLFPGEPTGPSRRLPGAAS
jgi:transcriptional regulator with XRE-family HTH domain